MAASTGISVFAVVLVSALLATVAVLWGHLKTARRVSLRQRNRLNEIEAYLRLDCRIGRAEEVRDLARRVCAVVSARSPFRRVAMFLRDADGKAFVAAAAAMEPQAVEMVLRWAVATDDRLKDGPGVGGSYVRLGERSVVVSLGEGAERGVVVPFSADAERGGFLVVMAASILNVRREMAEEAVISLEALATRVAFSLDVSEEERTALHDEQLADFGLLAGGIAHTLNNPLTAVMGYADLIGETASEEHVRDEAKTILSEARRMRDTIESLIHLWQPTN